MNRECVSAAGFIPLIILFLFLFLFFFFMPVPSNMTQPYTFTVRHRG